MLKNNNTGRLTATRLQTVVKKHTNLKCLDIPETITSNRNDANTLLSDIVKIVLIIMVEKRGLRKKGSKDTVMALVDNRFSASITKVLASGAPWGTGNYPILTVRSMKRSRHCRSASFATPQHAGAAYNSRAVVVALATSRKAT